METFDLIINDKILLTHDNLDRLYSPFIFANTPGYMFNEMRRVFFRLNIDLSSLRKEDIQRLMKFSESAEYRDYYLCLSLVLCSYLERNKDNDEFISNLRLYECRYPMFKYVCKYLFKHLGIPEVIDLGIEYFI